ncbi:hypothetical protein [Anabaena sp. CCY 9910]|uniref:hypothetical protein n=1 Tax=Anabaena sp. CCY 9910 TaxID=3103870 RepID=UPI0039E1243D
MSQMTAIAAKFLLLIEHECDRHNLRLLTKCANCETPFPIPAEWVQGECPHCFLPFATMAKRQKHC